MSSQMYTDLIVQELVGAAEKNSKSSVFKLPFIGTLSGSSVIVDALPTPIPYADFQHSVDEKTVVKPTYKNGDRLFIVPTNDGKQLVITGRLIT